MIIYNKNCENQEIRSRKLPAGNIAMAQFYIQKYYFLHAARRDCQLIGYAKIYCDMHDLTAIVRPTRHAWTTEHVITL